MERQTATKIQRVPASGNHVEMQSARSSSAAHSLIELQRSIGNQATQRLINSPYIQTKLRVSMPGDESEQEADRVADTVMRMPEPQPERIEENEESKSLQAKPLVQRAVPLAVRDDDDEEKVATKLHRHASGGVIDRLCTECEEEEMQRQPVEEEEKTLQGKHSAVQTPVIQRLCSQCQEDKLQRQPLEDYRPLERQPGEKEEKIQGKATGEEGLTVDDGIESQVNSLRGGGQPLLQSVRAYFEPRFEHDFSDVRIHTSAEAAKIAGSINAQAFTVGRDVAFGAGQYQPTSSAGQRLIAHELSHVIQQSSAAEKQTQRQQQLHVPAGVIQLNQRGSRRRQRACHAELCFHPIGMLGLGRLGALHGILDVTGSHGRHTMEIDPTQHMGCRPHSHVRVRSGSRGRGRGCIAVPLTCQQADAAVGAAAAYESMSVTYNPPPGPNSNSFPEWVLQRVGVNTSTISTPAGALGWSYFLRNSSERSSPPSIATPPVQTACHEPIRAARNYLEYVHLLFLAERRLRVAGLTQDQRLYALASIYYGAVWSRDFAAEHSCVRNLGFRGFSGHPQDITDEGPQTPHLLPCGLFFSLRASQDVEGVDMGHVMIGLHARAHALSRRLPLPHFGARGIEIVTWVGDLGGATARVALDRVTHPRASVDRYFRGNDYGAPSNLEGDVAAYVIADAGESEVSEPQFPDTIPDVATAVLRYFEGRTVSNRYRRFLELQGGVFAGERLTNQTVVEETIADGLAGFAPRYMENYLREHPRGFTQAQRERAPGNIPNASRDVAHRFVTWLLARMRQASPSEPSRRRRR